MIALLKDSTDGSVDAVIVSTESTQEDIQDIIDEVMDDEDFGGDILEEIKNRLPDDCKVYESGYDDFISMWY